MLEIDHVLIAVRDLELSAARFESLHGLASVPGGRHPAWGTANRIIPLHNDYIELIGVVDPDQAINSAFGRWLAGLTADGDHLLRCCLRPSDMDQLAERIGEEPSPGTRITPDGAEVHWRLLGLEAAMSANLPFFIEWDADSVHPSMANVVHPSGALGIAWVEIGGDPLRLREWLGEEVAAVRMVGGEPGLHAVAVITPGGDLVLR
ncbi:MAG: VOC family protein [Candidatus Dormibacteria bacterium]